MPLSAPAGESDREAYEPSDTVPDNEERPRVLIVSDIRFVREALGEILGRENALSIVGASASLGEAETVCRQEDVSIVLLDTALPDGLGTVCRIKAIAPSVRVVALAVAETDENVIAWAEAGAAGYVPRSAGAAELISALHNVMRGEQPCPARLAAGLLRRLAERAGPSNGQSAVANAIILTRREIEIARFIAEGLSNKEIARRLNIAVATAKSHVHNLLQKLGITRRGQVDTWMRRHGGPMPRLAVT